MFRYSTKPFCLLFLLFDYFWCLVITVIGLFTCKTLQVEICKVPLLLPNLLFHKAFLLTAGSASPHLTLCQSFPIFFALGQLLNINSLKLTWFIVKIYLSHMASWCTAWRCSPFQVSNILSCDLLKRLELHHVVLIIFKIHSMTGTACRVFSRQTTSLLKERSILLPMRKLFNLKCFLILYSVLLLEWFKIRHCVLAQHIRIWSVHLLHLQMARNN